MHEVAELELPTQENFQTDLRSLFQGAIRLTLEMLLKEEIRDMVGARRFERLGSRTDHRNGTYLRRLMTSMGTVELAVPRARVGGSAGGEVLGRYKRRTRTSTRPSSAPT
jgi:putative transposase